MNLVTNRAAFAVGTAALSSEDMYMAGGRGKGVRILHCYGDHLWTSGSKQEMPDLGVPDGLEFLEKKGGDKGDADDLGDSEHDDEVKDDEDAKENDAVEPEAKVEEDLNKLSIGEEKKQEDDDVEKEEEAVVDPRSPQEIMDERLERAFLQAWRTSAKRPEMPMLCSNFYRLHMVPQSQEALDVKKSSFKKLSKFLAHMQTKGIIKVQELQVRTKWHPLHLSNIPRGSPYRKAWRA